MAAIAVRRLFCDGDTIVKRGNTTNGKQRYLCQDEACSQRTFILEYTNRGCSLLVKLQIIKLALWEWHSRHSPVLGISTPIRS